MTDLAALAEAVRSAQARLVDARYRRLGIKVIHQRIRALQLAVARRQAALTNAERLRENIDV